MAEAEEIDLNDVAVPDQEYEPDEPIITGSSEVEVEFLTGAAGTGKTYEIRRRIAEDPKYGILAATTGVAAVNLDTITIHSLLHYFETQDLEGQYIDGYLQKELNQLAHKFKNLVIDEISMMDARQLDLIYMALLGMSKPLGLVVVGDFCQLPPIKAPFAFEADCWPRFAAQTTRLKKVWRQNDPQFLEALNLLRAGQGEKAGKILMKIGVTFSTHPDLRFKGTSIFGKNDPVNRFNELRLRALPGELMTFHPWRWGRQKGEWAPEKGLIPDPLQLKVGAQVMILANDVESVRNGGKFTYTNGDLGIVKGYDAAAGVIGIELMRNGQTVVISKLHRTVEQRELPKGLPVAVGPNSLGNPYFDVKRKRWIMGGIEYYPIRLGWASTVHKTQGLTLDRVQVDLRDFFFASPSMSYVAISRARDPEGLRIVGDPELLGRRCKVDEKVREWL